MSGSSGLRIALAGATGALGREVIAVLEEKRLPLRAFFPFATEGSAGEDVELNGELFPIEAAPPRLQDVDLLFLCTPPDVARELVRQALHAEVPCIDCSGALSDSEEVPILLSELCPPVAALGVPLIATPAGPTYAWALTLSALDQAAGLRRVVGTVLRSVALAGRLGIEALSKETIAILSQHELPDPSVFRSQVAFDCVPGVGESAPEFDGASASETLLARDLQRLLGRPVPISATFVQVPTFVGDGSALAVETERPIEPEALAGVFEKAPGLEVWPRDQLGPTTRDTVGRDVALVSRLRRDPSCENGLLLWLAADALRLTAANLVKLAEARLQLH